MERSEVGTVADLARLLRQLRRRQARRRGGAEVTCREMAARTGWSHGIIADYFAGKALAPTDRFDTLVRLLGAGPAEQGALATARDRVEDRRRQPGTVPEDPAVPRQLPPAPRHFVGRSAALSTLDSLVDRGAPAICTIDGTAGVGKTALAVYWAHRVADRFPDGQLYANLRGFDPTGAPVPPPEVLARFLAALGAPPDRVPAGPDARTGLYRTLLAGRRLLVLLDNARDAEQVRPLLPGAGACLTVVTSRSRLPGLVAAPGAQPVTLPLFTVDEARRLLTERIGGPRVAGDPGAVEECIAGCARLPLALSIVAARAAANPAFPLSAIAGELRAARGRLDAIDGGDAGTDVRAVLSWSYGTLGPPAARLFRLLGRHSGADVTVAAAADLTGLPAGQVRPALAELACAHLLAEPSPGRYTYHGLLRQYAAEQAELEVP